jgi:alkylresorcinol/alkylpyrone synthase
MRRTAPKSIFPQLALHDSLFGNTGIETRYACQPPEWYEERHGWEERADVFQQHALALLEEVTLKAVAAAGIELKDVGALVVNTITGLAIPSLDAKLMNRLELPHTVERLPIFGLGCGGGVAGLARAARYCHAMPGAHVLFLTVDLCSLCLRVNDPSMASSCRLPCSAMAPQGWCYATAKDQNGGLRDAAGSSPWQITSGAGLSTSWAGISRRTALASC